MANGIYNPNIFSQGFAPAPAFAFPGGVGPGCAPCGTSPYNNLPENFGNTPNQPCTPSNPSRPFFNNPTQQPRWINQPQNPQGWIPSPALPNLGHNIWNQPQFPQTGINPLQNCNPNQYKPSTTPQWPDRAQPYQPIDQPQMPNCTITNSPQMMGLPVAPANFVGWNNQGSAMLPYMLVLGTGIPQPPQMMYLGAPQPPPVVRPQPLSFMNTPKPLPSEICPLNGIVAPGSAGNTLII